MYEFQGATFSMARWQGQKLTCSTPWQMAPCTTSPYELPIASWQNRVNCTGSGFGEMLTDCWDIADTCRDIHGQFIASTDIKIRNMRIFVCIYIFVLYRSTDTNSTNKHGIDSITSTCLPFRILSVEFLVHPSLLALTQTFKPKTPIEHTVLPHICDAIIQL